MATHPTAALTGDRKHTIKHMWEIHHTIARYLVAGMKSPEIAELLGVSTQMISNFRNSPVGQSHLATLKAEADANSLDLRARIKEVAPYAIDVLTKVMLDDETSSAVKIRAAADILDRDGTVSRKIESKSIVAHLTGDQLKKIKDDANNTGLVVPSNGEVQADVEVKDVVED